MNELFSVNKLNTHILSVIANLTEMSENVRLYAEDLDPTRLEELQQIIDNYNLSSERVAVTLEGFIKVAAGQDDDFIEVEAAENGFKI